MESLFVQDFVDTIPFRKRKDHALVFNMLPAALSDVPFHEDTAAATRYVAQGFPHHLAVHEVSDVLTAPAEYTQPHIHEEHDEVNIILSEKKLLYKIRLGSEEFMVTNNSGIWVPRGMLHAANVIKDRVILSHFALIKQSSSVM